MLWKEIAASPTLATALISLLVAFLGLITLKIQDSGKKISKKLSKELKEVGAEARAAREQVTNNHDSNLRDDLDDVRVAVDKISAQLKYEMNELRGMMAYRAALADEREEKAQSTREDNQAQLRHIASQIENVRVSAEHEHARIWERLDRDR